MSGNTSINIQILTKVLVACLYQTLEMQDKYWKNILEHKQEAIQSLGCGKSIRFAIMLFRDVAQPG